MMKHEFEELAGYEVSYDDYTKIIEPMYMAVNMDKAEFVKTINKKRFALKPIKSIVKEMKAVAKEIKDICYITSTYDLEERLLELAHEYIDRKGWTGYAKCMLNDDMTVMKAYYIKSISIYGCKDYKTIEVIELV